MDKQVKLILIFNWKTGKSRLAKRKPTKYDPYEILVNMNITFEIPDRKEFEVKGNIKVSEIQASDMMMEELK